MKFDLEINAVLKVCICLDTRAVSWKTCKVLIFLQGSQGPGSQLPASPASQRPRAAFQRRLVSVCLAVSGLSSGARTQPLAPLGPPWASSLQLAGFHWPRPVPQPCLPQRPTEDPASHPPLSRLHPSPWGWFSHLSTFSGTTGLWLGRAGPQTPACSGGPEDRPAQPLAMLSLSPAQARLHATRVLTRRPLGRCLSTCSFSPWRSHSAQLGLDTTTSRKPPWHLPSCPGPGEVSSELTQAAPPRLQGLVPLFVSKQ